MGTQESIFQIRPVSFSYCCVESKRVGKAYVRAFEDCEGCVALAGQKPSIAPIMIQLLVAA